MSVDFLQQLHQSLLKVESTPGTDPTPTPAANYLRTLAEPVWGPGFEWIDPNIAGETLSHPARVVGKGGAMVRGQSPLTGAGTAGIAPDWGALMRAGGMQETLTAADVTGTSQAVAGGTVTLAAGASSTDNFYRGMVIKGTSGFYDQQERVIKSYVGSTKVATIYPNWSGTPSGTPTYSILANARYSFVSQGHSNYTYYGYRHGLAASSQSLLRKLSGAAATIAIQIANGGIGMIDWGLTGQFTGVPAAVSKPSVGTIIGAAPLAFRNASCILGGIAAKMNSVQFDFGNVVRQQDDPAATYGLDTASIIDRNVTGRIILSAVYPSTRDLVTDFLAGTQREFRMLWGTDAGQRVSIYNTGLQFGSPEEVDVNGFSGYSVPFAALPDDAEIFICAL